MIIDGMHNAARFAGFCQRRVIDIVW